MTERILALPLGQQFLLGDAEDTDLPKGADREQGPVLFHGHFIFADLVAAVDSRRGIFPAAFDPFDRRAQPHGQVAAQSFFDI